MNVHASAPGKLVLLGEYALFEGAPAMVAAIDRRVDVDLVTADQEHESSVDITHLKIGPISVSSHASTFASINQQGGTSKQLRAIISVLRSTGLFSRARQSYGRAFDLTINAGPFFSNGGIKYGFGSSAAITVAISGLAANLREGQPIDSERLVDHAIHIHRSMQSEMGSGIDVAASAVGGILKFQLPHPSDSSPPDLNRLTPLCDIHINAVWTGQYASTAAFLAGVAGFKARQPEAYRIVMQRLANASRNGIDAYQERQPRHFLAAVDEYSRGLIELSRLSDLPIFSPVHQQLTQITRAHGGIYKPSGAGGGDIGLAFTDDPQKHKRMAGDFNRAGFLAFDLRWGEDGFSLQERSVA